MSKFRFFLCFLLEKMTFKIGNKIEILKIKLENFMLNDYI